MTRARKQGIVVNIGWGDIENKLHSGLSALDWGSSGHTGTPSTLAGFDATGAATTVAISSLAPASGSGNYIWASPASAQTANMWISGAAQFGGNVTVPDATTQYHAINKGQLDIRVGNSLTSGYIPYWDGSKLVNSPIYQLDALNYGIGDHTFGFFTNNINSFSSVNDININGGTDAGINLKTNSVSRLYVNYVGDVGIGTTAPSGIGLALNMYGIENLNSNLVLEGNNGNSFLSLLSSATIGVPSSIISKDGVRFATASNKDATGFSEKMRISSDGSVNINNLSGTSTRLVTASSDGTLWAGEAITNISYLNAAAFHTARVETTDVIRTGTTADAAASGNTGALRYREDSNNSYLECSMKTGASAYSWVVVKQNTW